MKIKAIEPIAVSLPMKKPVQMAGETVTRADNVLVRIESDDGVVGWGEAASAPTMTGETVASMMAAVALLTPGLLKRPADDFAGASAAMAARLYGNSGAKAAIEIALHDLVGRATNRPVYALLGGRQRSRMPVLAVIGSEDVAADLREAKERWAAGYRAFKIKVGLRIGVRRRRTHTRRLSGAQGHGRTVSCLRRRQSGFWRRRCAGLRAHARRLRSRFLRAAGRSARSRRHGARRRGEPRADRRRRGPSFRRRHRPPS